MTLSFRLPSPPGVNNLFANIPGKGRVRTEAYHIWSRAAKNAMWLNAEGKTQRWANPIAGPVCVEIRSGHARQDIDACAKGILDLLTEVGVYGDDKQVCELHIMRGGNPREAVVIVREIEARAA